jgi:hypothetical protein
MKFGRSIGWVASVKIAFNLHLLACDKMRWLNDFIEWHKVAQRSSVHTALSASQPNDYVEGRRAFCGVPLERRVGPNC